MTFMPIYTVSWFCVKMACLQGDILVVSYQDVLAHDDELKLLEEEATIDIDQLKSSLPSEIFAEPAKPVFRDSSDESESEEEGEGEEGKGEQQEVHMETQNETGETKLPPVP